MRIKKQFFGLFCVVIIFSMLLAACAPAAPGASGGAGTIKIATQSPLSGGQSSIGGDIKNGAELALAQLSEPLKTMGFKVELAAFDDEANPDKGVANAKQIVADPAILCVVGHYNSGVQIPSSEVYHTSGLANVSPANTNPKVTDRGYKEVNRIVGRDDIQGAGRRAVRREERHQERLRAARQDRLRPGHRRVLQTKPRSRALRCWALKAPKRKPTSTRS